MGKVQINIRLETTEERDRIREAAEYLGLTQNEFVRGAVTRWLDIVERDRDRPPEKADISPTTTS